MDVYSNNAMEDPVEDRINKALKTLKNELIEMRSLDIKLMKQLLSINDTIQKLTKGHTMTRTQSCKSRISSKRSPMLQQTKELNDKPIRRLQSTPSFCRLSSFGSCASLDDSSQTIDENFYYEESDEDSIFMKNRCPSHHNSVSCIAPLTEDETNESFYEEILRANIKVWKSSSV